MADARARISEAPRRWARIGLALYALFMSYIHSLYITGFYVSEEEYWWTGMTLTDRLTSLGLGLAANLGLLLAPFLRESVRMIKVSLMISLAFGSVLSGTWLIGDLTELGFAPYWPDRKPVHWYLFGFTLFWIIKLIHGYALYQYLR